jgi:hypothetical protein
MTEAKVIDLTLERIARKVQAAIISRQPSFQELKRGACLPSFREDMEFADAMVKRELAAVGRRTA